MAGFLADFGLIDGRFCGSGTLAPAMCDGSVALEGQDNAIHRTFFVSDPLSAIGGGSVLTFLPHSDCIPGSPISLSSNPHAAAVALASAKRDDLLGKKLIRSDRHVNP